MNEVPIPDTSPPPLHPHKHATPTQTRTPWPLRARGAAMRPNQVFLLFLAPLQGARDHPRCLLVRTHSMEVALVTPLPLAHPTSPPPPSAQTHAGIHWGWFCMPLPPVESLTSLGPSGKVLVWIGQKSVLLESLKGKSVTSLHTCPPCPCSYMFY